MSWQFDFQQCLQKCGFNQVAFVFAKGYFFERMNARDYLTRISYAGRTEPTLEVLAGLQEAHLLSVPFENLDIHTGTPIRLDVPRLYHKIVEMRRGGFCYELNGLFHWLLTELGFQTRLLMGRVFDKARGTYGQEFDHLLCMTNLDGRDWLVDVGYGDFSMRPLAFTLNRPLADANGKFLFEGDTDGYYRVSRFSEEEKRYLPEYRFSLKERKLSDFTAMCEYHQTSPLSSFTQSKVCSIATATGRITLTDSRLIITESGTRSETRISGQQEFNDALARRFNIHWPDPIAGEVAEAT
jgi:N-hydroxyarylamine O-acetyltransferase